MPNPVPMVRIKALLLARDERAALQSLGELGLLHLIRERAGPDTAPLEPPPTEAEMAAWDGLLGGVERVRLTLGIPPCPPQPIEDPEDCLKEIQTRAQALLERRDELHHLREAERAHLTGIEGFLGLELPLNRVGQGPFLHLALGNLPEGRVEEAREALGSPGILLALPPRNGRQPLLAMGTAGIALDRLRKLGFQEERLPREGTLDGFIETICRKVDRLAQREKRLEEEIETFSKQIAGPLAGVEERIRMEKALLEAQGHFPRTDTAFLLQGWIPAVDAPLLENQLRSATGGRCVLELSRPETAAEEQVPVLLRPSPLLRPFEKLVAGFGLPRYLELSPTPFVAVSYLLMFGIMFGDVGHGLILAMVGLLAWRKWPDAGLLLLGGGTSSTLFGAIYGSCFGLPRFKAFALWHDPLEGDPIHLMTLAIGLGVLMISLGLVLNILNRIRRGDVLGALMDRFGLAGILFYWGALGLILWRGALAWPILALLLLPIAAWVLKEPLQASLRHREHGSGITDALVEAFETLLVYLANTISFVRLAAYAMSHAALLAATLLMADAVAPPLSWLVIILGNLAAILLEGVIASVQALRLEYYEFFGKFFSGAGRPFQPFRLNMKEGEA